MASQGRPRLQVHRRQSVMSITGHRRSHPFVMIDQVTDDPTPEDLEQPARSVAMSGVLGDRDHLDVVTAPRRIAEIDEAKRRHPSDER